MTQALNFTNTWFDGARWLWMQILPELAPKRLLEIGTFEGQSACFLVEVLAAQYPIELHCIDSWQGGIEHQAGGEHATDMAAVEARFRRNIKLAIEAARHPVKLVVRKENSDRALARILADGREKTFDFVYVDGSHQAADVLCDAVLAFRLLRIGGVMIFDDYAWAENLRDGIDPLRCPKPAIDAFVNTHLNRLRIVEVTRSQFAVQRTA